MNSEEGIIKNLKRKIRSGSPAGEWKSDLLTKGYSADEVQEIMSRLSKAAQKESGKIQFNIGNSVVNLLGISLFISGIVMTSVKTWLEPVGYFLIVIGLIMYLFQMCNRNK